MEDLSDAALAFLRRRLDGERIAVDEFSRQVYRELAAAGLMIPLHRMTGGDEGAFRWTEAGATFFSNHHAFSEASPAPAH